YVWAFDWAGNWTGAGSWNLGIDRTSPTATVDVSPMYGDAPFRDFHVRWYGSDNLSGIASYDVQVRDVGMFSAWNDLVISTTQVYTRFVGQDGITYQFRARARDHAGNLGDYSADEVSYTVDICDVAPDAYEIDNTISSASWITPDGYAQIHNVHVEEDTDWVKFEAQAGVTYTLTTGNTGDHADTVLELYDTDGSTLLAENDDCPGRWPASCLDWQAHADGVYYAKVYHWDPWAYGCTTEYGLSIVSDRPGSLELGEPGTSFRYTETLGVTETAYPANTSYLNGPNGLFIDAGDHLYVAEQLGARMLKYRTSDGANLLSIGAAGFQNRGAYTFNHPRDVAVDGGGNIWTADQHRVAQYDAGGNFLQEFPPDDPWNAGDDAHFDTPRGIAFDSSGRMYVSDSNNHRIQVYTFDVDGTPVYSTSIGVTGQPGDDDAHFNRPAQIVINSSDRLFVADVNNHRVQRCYYNDGWTCYTIHGTGSAGDGSDELNLAYGLGINDAGEIYIADGANGRVKECYAHMFGWTCNTFVDDLGWPVGVSVDSAGHVYVSDWSDHTIREYDSDGNAQGVLAGTSGVPYLTDEHHFNKPADVAVDGDGNRFVVEEAGQRLLKLGPNGNALAVVGTPGVTGDDDAHLNGAQGVAVSADGTVYLADTWNHRVQIFDNDLNYQTTLGTGRCESAADAFCGPHNVTLDAGGRLYVADTWNHRVQVFDSSYNLVATLGVTGQTGQDNLHFHTPRGVAVDTEGFIYVAEETNKRVQKCVLVGESGSCTTFAGVTGVDGDDFAHLRAPLDVAVDADNRVYVNDSWWNQRVQVFDSSGAYLTTISGAWGGQHGRFRHPNGIGIAPDGAVYVADADNMRIEQYTLGVPDWQQVNVNGFGDRDNVAGGVSLHAFGDHLYAGFWRSSGGQLWRAPDGTTWVHVSNDGLGNIDNISIVLGATFDGYLYAGTWNETAGCEIYRSADGLSWDRVAAGGFDDSDNTGVGTMRVFSDHLYVSTYNGATGVQLWRSSNGSDWAQVNADGFGDSDNISAWSMAVFDGALYVGTQNADTGAEIWRAPDGVTWEQVGQDGFGDAHNQWPHLAVYDGDLYVGFANDSTDTHTGLGTQVWRSADGDTWEHVVDDGFGDATNGGSDTLIAFGPYLYAGTYNRGSGSQLRRTSDGSIWTKVAPDGFGDSNNYSTYGGALFGDRLFLATSNDAHGIEVWRADLQLARADFDANPTRGIAPLAVEFTNLATGDYDACTWDFGDGGVSSNCDDPTHTYDPDADALENGAGYAYTVTLTVAGAGGRATETKRSYVTAIGLYKVYLPLTIRNWPPVPGTSVLNTITAPGPSTTYRIDWDPAIRADTYILERATHGNFSDTEEVYSGPNTSHTVDSEGMARYYYRVKARNSWGDSGWSNAQSAEVRWEKESNNNAKTQASGPLVSGSTYYGLLPADDVQDYFYFDLSAAHSVELWLTNIASGEDYDVYLRDASLSIVRASAQAGNVDEYFLTGDLQPGRYYIQVYNDSASGSTQPYHLRVLYE
ncbi:MAG TPA: hypothetical protein ENN19_06380, partial [Chloroflexi bacterium]|nr:hypothetical protein [Chloroflexota bacterium]